MKGWVEGKREQRKGVTAAARAVGAAFGRSPDNDAIGAARRAAQRRP